MVRSVVSRPHTSDLSNFSTSNPSWKNSWKLALSTPKSSMATRKPKSCSPSVTARSNASFSSRADSVISISMSDRSIPYDATVLATRSTKPSSSIVRREKFTAKGIAGRPSCCQRATVSHDFDSAKKSRAPISSMSSNAGMNDAGSTSLPRSGSR